MKEKVKMFIRKHQMINHGDTVLIAVSGGPDSMALLHILKDMQSEWSLTLKVLSVDHQLRGEASIEDLKYVRKICEKWNISFIGTSVDVRAYKMEHGVGTQVAARDLRYHFFENQMKDTHADCLALGHHGDDQVETVLMNLVRSTSTKSLSGIPTVRSFAGGTLIRPLLPVTKQEIEIYCEEAGIVPRRDPSNDTTDYTRNDFRKRIVPLLKEKNNHLHTGIQHLSESLQADETYLASEAKTVAEQIVTFSEMKDKAVFEIDQFKMYPIALQRRVYHLILNYLYNNVPDDLSYRHETIFFTLLRSNRSNIAVNFPRQLIVNRSYGKLSFYFQKQDWAFNFMHQLHVPGEVILPNGSRFAAVLTDTPSESGVHRYVCQASQLTFPLHIRTRRSGDRMYWKGLGGHKKIKDIFIDMKIPRPLRDEWPIVVDGSGLLIWLAGLRKDDFGHHQCVKGPYIQIDYFESET